MRRFSSYGPINTEQHFYVPRKDLITKGHTFLIGDNPEMGGHYFTVWAPRQTGKTWLMTQLVGKIKQSKDYHIGIISLQLAQKETSENDVLEVFLTAMKEAFGIDFPRIKKIREIRSLFTKQYFQKPVILIIDEFDALQEEFINSFANVFREMYISRNSELTKKSIDQTVLLHGLALIGVRSVLGIENTHGSPFNTQRSLPIPNLTLEEVQYMFSCYEQESGQKIHAEVVKRLFIETNGQPGLISWFGEMLTEGFQWYTNDKTKPITKNEFEIVYAAAIYALPNNNIMNLISKAKETDNKEVILYLFQTQEKLEFAFDNKIINALFMNGLIVPEIVDQRYYYIKFACPFVQKRLFNYFSNEYFNFVGRLVDPMVSMGAVIGDTTLNIRNIINLYQVYLQKNSTWLFKSVPRRKDMRIHEAIFHFNLYAYLHSLLKAPGGEVIPEFPTGNGKIDLLISFHSNRYGLELKSFSNERNFIDALEQASCYGKHLNLAEIFLIVFIEKIDEAYRIKYQKEFPASQTGVKVIPLFVETGE